MRKSQVDLKETNQPSLMTSNGIMGYIVAVQ